MATGTLTSTTIAARYKSLLKITGTGNDVLAADAVAVIEDGDGNDSSLSFSQQRATITLGSGSADDFIVDGTTLVVEGDNNRVGIGTAAPASLLHMDASSGSVFRMTRTSGATSGTLGEISMGNTNVDNGMGGLLMAQDGATNSSNLQLSTQTAGGAATTRLMITSTGNVGIGTTTPFADGLSVTGAAGYDEEGILQITTGTGADSDSKLVFGVVDTDYAYIQSVKPGDNRYDLALNPAGGKVGIGTAAPDGPLHIMTADVSMATVSADADDLVIENDGPCGITIGSAADSIGSIRFADPGGNKQGMFYYNHVDNSLRIDVNNAQAMHIDSNNNVGIVTTSPRAALDVHVAAAFSVTSSSTAHNLRLSRDATAGDGNFGGSIVFSAIDVLSTVHAGIAWVQAGSDADQGGLAFFHHGGGNPADNILETMRVNASGSLGIGSTSPTTSSSKGVEIQNTTTDANDEGGALRLSSNHGAQGNNTRLGVLEFVAYDGAAFATGAKIDCQTKETWDASNNAAALNFYTTANDDDPTIRMTIGAAGQITAPDVYTSTAGSANVSVASGGRLTRITSSKKYKDNINYDGVDVSVLYNMKPCSYIEKATGIEFIGLIAEDVHEIEPRLVEYREINGKDEPDAIKYDHISAVLIKAVQELSAKVTALENA